MPVFVDFLSFSIPNGKVGEIFGALARLLDLYLISESGYGKFGYESSAKLGEFGVICHGGVSQRGTVLVSLSGKGCARMGDMSECRAVFEQMGARITRVDLAADDLDGGTFSVRAAVAGWKRGLFTLGGRPPLARVIDDLGTGAGSTFYVGSREAGKLCRIYEKGRQLGDAVSAWVRGEVEFHRKDRILPWDMVTNPVPYLAGSYPMFKRLSLIATRIPTCRRSVQVSLSKLVTWARQACGKTINVLLQAHEGDCGALVTSLRRAGCPGSLKEYALKNGLNEFGGGSYVESVA